MFDDSYLKKSGQVWKLGVLGLSGALGAVLMWVGQSRLQQTAGPGLGLLFVGVGLVFAGGAWAVWAIRCPVCRTKLLWKAVKEQPSGAWLQWLLGLTGCPTCTTPSGVAQ